MSNWKDSIMTHTEMCDEIDSLRARLADEQAKRVAAENEVADLKRGLKARKHRIGNMRRKDHKRHEQIATLNAKIADLERRLLTVPEDFGALIDNVLHANLRDAWNDAKDVSRAIDARTALIEKIAALQFRLEAAQKEVARLRNQSDPLSDAAVSDYDELLAERDALALRLGRIAELAEYVCDAGGPGNQASDEIRRLAGVVERQKSALSTERCGNWPCVLPAEHDGPCSSSVVEKQERKSASSQINALMEAARATLTEQRREFSRGDVADLDQLEDALRALEG